MGGPSLYNRWWERLAWESGKGLAGPPRASPSACVLGPGGLGPGPRQPHEAPAYCAPELHLSLCHAGPGEGAWPCEGRGRIGAGQERGLGQLQGRVIPDPFAAPPPPAPRPPQAAVAQSFEREQLHFGRPSSYFVQLPQYIQRCRDHMIQSLQSMGFRPVIPQGSYFLITDISDFSKWARPRGAEAGALEAAQDSARLLSPRKQDA